MTARPDAHVLAGLAGIGAILLIASIISAVGSSPELRLRVRSWWVMATIFSVAIVLTPNGAIVLFAFLSYLAFKEYLSLIPTRPSDRRVLLLAYLSIPLQYWWIARMWYGMFVIFIPVYMLLILPARMVLIGETKGFLRAVGTLHWGLMMTVFAVSHVAYLLVLPASMNPHGGAAWVLYLVVLTEGNDVAQYVWGRSLGRHPVVPSVSPNKTWEGLIGGVITTVFLGVILARWLTPFTPVQALTAAAIIGVAGFMGDVVISALKRDLGIKDSGTLLPGHGGILDRIDSLVYTAPLFFHYVHYVRG